MDASNEKYPSMPAPEFALKLRRHNLIVVEPQKLPGFGIAYPSYRPGAVAVYPVIAKDSQISGQLAEIVRRRLGIDKDRFWPPF